MKKFLAIFVTILGLACIVLMFTNPSMKRFKEFSGKYKSWVEKVEDHHRNRNYFIFSYYSTQTVATTTSMFYGADFSYVEHHYIGIFGNFFWLRSKTITNGSGFNESGYPEMYPYKGIEEYPDYEGDEEDYDGESEEYNED